MAQMLGAAALCLFGGVLAYCFVRRAGGVDFWVPLTTRQEVALVLGLTVLALAASLGAGLALALEAAGAGHGPAWAMGAVAAGTLLSVLRRPLLRRYKLDVAAVNDRRAARAAAKQRRRERR